MSSKSIIRIFLIITFLLFSQILLAQHGTIKGVVIDAKTGDPLPGANVLVQGLEIGSATNVDGEYTISEVPVGQQTIIARFIGYKTQIKVINAVGGEVTEANFNLEETVLALDEVVVTGVGVASEKKKLGNTIATINMKTLETAPITRLSDILQGREPGVNSLPSGGLVGEGTRIRIRGSASLSQSNEPIVYVDGIRVDNSGGLAGNNATFYYGGGGSPSRLDDINPEAIERIEILKSAAAATLYGTQAANGIIQIFTKQGAFGKPKFNVEIEQSAIAYPDAYHSNAGFARNEEQAARMSELFGVNIQPFEIFEKNFTKQLFSTGHGQTYSLSVNGGGSGVTYFASGRFQLAQGPYNPQSSDFLGKPPGGSDDMVRRGQFAANVNIIPSNKLRIRLSSLYSNIHQEIPDNNNNIFGVISLAMMGKPEVAM